MPLATHRRSVVAAVWMLSVALAIGILFLARRASGGAPEVLQALALIGLSAVPWAVDRALRTRPRTHLNARSLQEWVTLAMQHTGYSVTITDAQRRILYVNDSFTQLTGYTAQEALGHHTSE